MGTTVLDRTSTKDPLITVVTKIGRSRVKVSGEAHVTPLPASTKQQSHSHTLGAFSLFSFELFPETLTNIQTSFLYIVFAVMGGSGEKRVKGFQGKRGVPKGFLAIKVGQGEDQQRFVVPVIYFNHPLFMQLLKEAEEEYGFDQKGTITIPCHVEQFRNVRGIIDSEKSLLHHNHARCFGF
ncbi:hypothetical protein V8G54_034345 [Vigna mungo]|uniref:Uncharacterized protein n=1 Tax=Vigna mungo TaxID=3915 RepID=A0AAQ3MQA9_VIGMU